MKRTNATENTAMSLERLCSRVATWRAHREGAKSRVPEELWNEAVAVARVRGPWATAKAIRFNYMDLKKRMSQVESRCAEPNNPTFVEIQLSAIDDHRAESRVVVELFGSRGDRMRIESDCGALDVVGLAHSFWSRVS